MIHKAVVLEMFGAPEDLHYPGSGLDIVEFEEHPGFYWVVTDGKQTRDLVSNNFGEMFRIVDEIKKAS